jgi:acetyl-CoA carboxylase carboxyltransferase component
MPQNVHHKPAHEDEKLPNPMAKAFSAILPANQNSPFSMHDFIDAFIDHGSFVEVKKRFAQEIVCGFARIGGAPIGIVANQPKYKGGVLFVDSADKAARFIWLCDAFQIPLVFLADVPGFMIGSKVEKQGIIRHGAKMVSAMADATVPKFSVIVRKAYGAGLYAMAGPAFEPEACIALPGAMIAVMGAEAAVNAVYFNKIQEKPEAERAAYVAKLRDEYNADIAIEKLAAELIIDGVVAPENLREELITRLRFTGEKSLPNFPKRRSVTPV